VIERGRGLGIAAATVVLVAAAVTVALSGSQPARRAPKTPRHPAAGTVTPSHSKPRGPFAVGLQVLRLVDHSQLIGAEPRTLVTVVRYPAVGPSSEIDEAEDELYGHARGDELRAPEDPRGAAGRSGRGEAKARVRSRREREREDRGGRRAEAEDPGVKIELESEVIVARIQGRVGWLREARRRLDEHRRRQAKPIARSRPQRLLESERRLAQDLEVERAANEAYEHYRAHGRDKRGRRLGRPPKPYEPPETPWREDQHDRSGLAQRADPAQLHPGLTTRRRS
jgi:hypothetical protein